MSSIEVENDKPLQEKCGIVAVYSPQPIKQTRLALLLASGVQHRGQQGAGIVSKSAKGLHSYVGDGLLKDVFNETVIKKLDTLSTWTMVHCRYGTSGGYDKRNLQPCLVASTENFPIALIHNGQFTGLEDLRKKIGSHFPKDISDTYLFAQLLSSMEGLTWEHRIIQALSLVKGAYSLMIGIDNKLFVTRDELGVRPLIMGKLKNQWVFASETHSLDKVGATIIREVKRGEIIKVDHHGINIIKRGLEGKGHFCDFEWAYFGRPDSLLPTHETDTNGRHPTDWLSISHFRERCGTILAEELPIKNATFVVGNPDSGMAVAIGYANALNIPYRQAIIRDHFDPNGSQRLFMRDDQKKKIKKKVLGKLSIIPDKKIWKDAIVVIGDDSIVRGNVTMEITKAVFSMGAKEVHWIIGFPPVSHPCHLGVSIRTHGELVAAELNADSKKIAKRIGATSVNYISNKGFIKARLLLGIMTIPQNIKHLFLDNGGCGGCITGEYPLNENSELHKYITKTIN